MKRMVKIFKGHKALCFLDFEGTQFSHEMIAYGAQLVIIDKNGKIVKTKSPIKRLVKAKNSIGRFVENLTGLKRVDLDRFGVSFSTAVKDLKKYCGLYFKKCSFVTFGTHDMRIFNQSISYNLDSPKPICDVIKSNFVDFQAILSEFVKDEKGNVMSLEHYLEAFGLSFEGKPHDPQYDASNLARLYDAFMTKKDIIYQEFKKNLKRMNFHPGPIDKVIKKLLNDESVSPKDFEEYIKEYID